MCERLHNARTKWEEIGLKLSVPPETLESINLRHKDYHDKCLREMLTWYLEHDGPLTWRDLCDCLRSPSVGRNDVAKVIERWMSVFTSGVYYIFCRHHNQTVGLYTLFIVWLTLEN